MSKKLVYFCVTMILLLSVPSWADIVRDDFNTPVDYMTATFPSGIWDGKVGLYPASAGEFARQMNADINDPNGRLFFSLDASDASSWEGVPGLPIGSTDSKRGPFLYKNVKSNYWIMQVRVVNSQNVAWNLFGLQARAKLYPVDQGTTIDEAGTGEDTEGTLYFTPVGTLFNENLNDGAEYEYNSGLSLRPYLRMAQDINSQGNPRFYYYGSTDGTNWERFANSPRTRADLKGLELQLGMRQANYNNNNAWCIFDDFLLLYQGPGQAWYTYPSYEVGNIDARPLFTWVVGDAQASNGHHIYISSVESEVVNRTASMNAITTEPNYPITAPDLLMPLTKYYWAVDEINGVTTTTGDVWSFVTEAAAATNPQPADGSGGVLVSLAQVGWIPYEYATGQKIYFSKNFADVNSGVGGVSLGAAVTSYNSFTKPLDVQTDYFWRIDTIVGANTYRGPIWKFTTAFPLNFCANFETSWDYYVNGVVGTIFNGVVGETQLYSLNTDTTPGKLRIESNGYWGGQYTQGVLLYKEVDGPYIATVEVTNLNGMPDGTGAIAGQQAGLMQRLPDLRWGRAGGDSDAQDEDWTFLTFYPTWNVGNMINVQGWRWNTSGTGGSNTRYERGRMWTGWPINPNPTGAPNLANASGRFLMIDYKGHTGINAGRSYLRWSQNGSTWFNYNQGDIAAVNNRDFAQPLNRYGDFNNYPHQVGIAHSVTGLGFAEFDNFCLGRELQAKASGPSPASGGSIDIMNALLAWSPGDLFNNQDFYFGTNEAAVADANRNSTEYKGDQNSGYYYGLGDPDPYTGLYTRYACDIASQESLILGTTYYWRIDEVNELSEPDDVWKGDVWSFALLNYSIVDTFEPYASTGAPGTLTSLRATWLDGYIGVGYNGWQFPNPPDPIGTSGSYAQISNDNQDGNTITTNVSLAGGKSLKLYYDNDGSVAWVINLFGGAAWQYYPAPMYSEVSAAINDAARIDDFSRGLYAEDQASLGMSADWTAYTILRIPYYGAMNNTKLNAKDKIYVGLKDGDGTLVVLYNPDADAVLHQGWHNWYIELSAVAAANPALDLTNMARIYLGVGDRAAPASGGRGAIFIDEIQLLTTTVCATVSPANTELTSVAGDFSANCATNATDLQRLTQMWQWQASATPILPDANKVVHLDASGLALGSLNAWANAGTAGGTFRDPNAAISGRRPTVMMVEGVKAVMFDSNDCLIADVNSPDSITGTKPFTVIYKVWNESFGGDEELFTWAKRGTTNRAAAICFGDGTAYEAAAFWGGGDTAFSTYQPAAHQWHTIAQTYQGGTNGRYYVVTDGKYNTNVARSLDLWPNCYMTVGTGLDGDPYLLPRWAMTPGSGYQFTGALAEIKIYNLYTDPGALAFMLNTPMNMKTGDTPEIIDFKDIAVFANGWMVEDLLGD